MVKQVEGYMTSQGRFFATQREADLSEAYHQLNQAMDKESLDIGDFFYTCKKYPILVRNYINALIEVLPDTIEDQVNDIESIEIEASDEVARQSIIDPIDENEPISFMDLEGDQANPD